MNDCPSIFAEVERWIRRARYLRAQRRQRRVLALANGLDTRDTGRGYSRLRDAELRAALHHAAGTVTACGCIRDGYRTCQGGLCGGPR